MQAVPLDITTAAGEPRPACASNARQASSLPLDASAAAAAASALLLLLPPPHSPLLPDL
jgi:hypothetical protein